MPLYAARLRETRPNDVVVEAAAGAAAGSATLYLSGSLGNSTLVETVAADVASQGVEFSEILVQVVRLDDVLEQSGLDGRTIHFCSIDVEGSEPDVLAGFDLSRWRPWVLVVEATEPNRRTSSHTRWEDRVLAAGYRFCLFDGVNRFYVHSSKADDLQDRLSSPACIFDEGFRRSVDAARRAIELESLASAAQARTKELEGLVRDADRRAERFRRVVSEESQRVNELERRLRELADAEQLALAANEENRKLAGAVREAIAELEAMRVTVSWRLTRPLRVARGMPRILGRGRRSIEPLLPSDGGAGTLVVEAPETNGRAVGLAERPPDDPWLTDGGQGPRFCVSRPDVDDPPSRWPEWSDRLPRAHASQSPVEGGRRVDENLARERCTSAPLVSYVTVVKDGSRTLDRAIQSVRDQTYGNVEHIVLDGASTDNTLELLTRRESQVEYFASEPDEGLYDALNKAIPLARGDLICVLNSDDWLEPHAAEIAVERLTSVDRPAILLSGANVRRSSGSGYPEHVSNWYPALVHPGCYFTCADDCHNAIYATRSAYESSGSYDNRYRIAGDFNWIMDCLASGVDFFYTRERTINYVMGGLSSDPRTHAEECVRTMRRRFPTLTTDEAGGLHHIFFFVPPDDSMPGKPSDRAAFLRKLLVDHAAEQDLLGAIAWALAHRDARY